MARFTVLMDSHSVDPKLSTEWGLAILIETQGKAVLFDTGASDQSLANGRKMGCLPDRLEAIIISHGHYDHTGGLRAWLNRYPNTKVFAHPETFGRRYLIREDKPKEIGSRISRNEIEAMVQVKLSREPVKVVEGVHALGEIPRVTEFETPDEAFFHDSQGGRPDHLPDDQAVVVEVTGGLAVLCGCAHSGVINILRRVEEVFPARPVHLMMGGLHLKDSSAERIGETVEGLLPRLSGRLAVGHCTGEEATQALQAAFGDELIPMASGLVLEA